MIKLNPSVKHHALIGVFMSAWIFVFAFIVRPFSNEELGHQLWVFISAGFGLIAFLSYGALSLLQNWAYKKTQKWNVGYEIAAILLFHLFYLMGTYLYYKSPIINGGMDFFGFLSFIILRTAIIITPILVLARRYSDKLRPLKEDDITLKGENKLDILRIKKNALVCISKSHNYVEIYYLQHGQLKTKLIRSSLSRIEKDQGFLLRVHRSHLVNPAHFKDWKNQDTISLTQIDIPVTKNYKKGLTTL